MSRLSRYILKKVLVVMKTAKYDSYHLDNFRATKQIENVLSKFEESKAVHESNCHKIMLACGSYHQNIDFIRIDDLHKPIYNYDAVLTLGGDGTFLRAASFIRDKTPIIGVNTDSQRSKCSFCDAVYHPATIDKNSLNERLANFKSGKGCLDNNNINPKREFYSMEHSLEMKKPAMTKIIDDVNAFWEKLMNKKFDLQKRTRIQIEIKYNNNKTDYIDDHLALNEIMVSDAEKGKTSSFTLKVDNNQVKSFKNSGFLLITGSGSSGWLQSISNLNLMKTKRILKHFAPGILEKYSESELCKLIEEYNRGIIFPKDSEKLYYLLREPIFSTNEDILIDQEGFCNSIELQSTMQKCVIISDGTILKTLPFGTVITMKKSENDLMCIQITQYV